MGTIARSARPSETAANSSLNPGQGTISTCVPSAWTPASLLKPPRSPWMATFKPCPFPMTPLLPQKAERPAPVLPGAGPPTRPMISGYTIPRPALLERVKTNPAACAVRCIEGDYAWNGGDGARTKRRGWHWGLERNGGGKGTEQQDLIRPGGAGRQSALRLDE